MPDSNQYYPFGNPADQIIPDSGDMGGQIPNPNDQTAGQMPGYSNPYGQMPAGMPRPMMPGQMPAGMPRPMMPGQMPAGMPRPMMPGQMPAGMPRPMMPGQMPAGMPRPMMPGQQMQQGFPQAPYGQQMNVPVVQEEQEEVKEEAEQKEENAVVENVEQPEETTNEPQPDENGIIDDLADLVQEEYVNPYDTNFAATFGLPPAFIRAPLMFTMFAIFMVLGVGIGWFFGQMKPTGPEQLPGVIKNSEIPTGRPRCGIAQKGQGCVLYIMNASPREIAARDLFQMASDMTEVPKFQIETHNPMYAPQTIPPGYIALINVPPN